MAPLIALPLFAVSLTVTLRAASTFARRLDQLGAKFGLPEVLIGLLTALAADGPAGVLCPRCIVQTGLTRRE